MQISRIYKWIKRIEREGIWKNIVQKLCLAGICTKARAANWTHFL